MWKRSLIVTSPILSSHIRTLCPENMGRATVYGLTLHNTEISGSTMFLPHPDVLPLGDIPLIILAPDNYGKTLGNYTTNWRQSRTNLIVIDEIPDRNAHFVNIGRLHNNIVPVSFYGVH